MLVSVSWGDGKFEIRDLSSGQIVTNLIEPADKWIWRNAVAFSPDGKVLAVSTTERVLLYDTLTWRQLPSIERRLNSNWRQRQCRNGLQGDNQRRVDFAGLLQLRQWRVSSR